MPTEREREYYAMGFRDGYSYHGRRFDVADFPIDPTKQIGGRRLPSDITAYQKRREKRKLSDWQKYVKLNSKFPRFKYKSGKKKGMINLKALGIAYRKTSVYKLKKKRR